MRIEIYFTVETSSFGGKEFMEEIKKLLTDIAEDAGDEIKLKTFKMQEVDGDPCDWRAYRWRDKGELTI